MPWLPAATILSLALGSAPAAPQSLNLSGYCDALRLFATDRPEEAVARLNSWSADALRRVVAQTARCVGRGVTPPLAIVALTYAAVAQTDGPPEQVAAYLGLAESLLHAVIADDLQRGDQAVAGFQEDWFVVASSLMMAWTNPAHATRFVDHGLALFKNSARLHTLSGMATEMRAHIRNHNLHDPMVVAEMPRDALRTLLFVAEGEYRRALELDPQATAARVHLGRVLFLRKEIGQSREILAPVTGDPAAPARWRYLAHLFAGAGAEFEHDLRRARSDYQAAVMTMPEMQAGRIALSYVERSLGNERRAQQLIAELADAPAPEENDPWSEYQNGGFDIHALGVLRERVAPR